MGGAESKGPTTTMPVTLPYRGGPPEEQNIEIIKRLVLTNAGDFGPSVERYANALGAKGETQKIAVERRYRRSLKLQENVSKGLEALEQDLESDEDLEHFGQLRCIHWNCGGLRAQFDKKRGMGFATVLAFLRPQIVMLNEIKCRESDSEAESVISSLAGSCGYRCIYTPSVHPNNRAMRGTAIFYKSSDNFRLIDQSTHHGFESAGAYGFEFVQGNFELSGEPITFCSFYLAPPLANARNFQTISQQFKNAPSFSILAGDLNLRKEDYLKEFKTISLHDTMNPDWKTNWSQRTATAIDYVLTRAQNLSHMVTHKPILATGSFCDLKDRLA